MYYSGEILFIAINTIFHIANAPNITIEPMLYGIKASFTFTFSSIDPIINCNPNTKPTAITMTVPTTENMLNINRTSSDTNVVGVLDNKDVNSKSL